MIFNFFFLGVTFADEIMSANVEEKHRILLDEIYFNSEGAKGSFSTVLPLYAAAKKKDSSITQKIVRNYLQGNLSYLLHKRVRRKFDRRAILNFFPHETWSIDLIFYTSDQKSNDNKAFCLNVIDNFSHLAFGRVLKNKTASETLSKFKEILAEAGVKPKRIFQDRGSEFFGAFAAYCKENDIKQIFSTTPLKAFPAEIYNNSLKLLIERLLEFRRNRKWIAVLQQAVKIYNHTEQVSLLGKTPIEAATSPDVIAQLQAYNFRKRAKKAEKFAKQKPAFFEGQIVKKTEVDPFRQRVTHKRFSKENFKVRKIVKSAPFVYKLSKTDGTPLPRSYYKDELSASQEDDILNKSISSKRILAILSKKQFATKWLRSGRPLTYEVRFMVRSNDRDGPFYANEEEIANYDNGTQMLRAYLDRQEHGETS